MHPRNLRPIGVAALPLALLVLAGPALAAEPASEADKKFYALGVALHRNLVPFALTAAESKFVIEGLQDASSGKADGFDIEPYGPSITQLRDERMKAAAEKEIEASAAFLVKAAAESGAIKTDSGLIYVELKGGSGTQPVASDTVRVHYHGTLRDGTVFDSSVDRGEPINLPLNRVIPCWTEGVGMMKPGGKARLTCPSDIAYGDRGSPPAIPGGAALVFEVELLEIVSSG